MYYVRKLSKPSNLFKIKQESECANVPADFIGQELRTCDNTLSVWRCNSLDDEETNKAIKAAIFASSKIAATQFIILDSEMLKEAQIKICDNEGKTAYKGLNYLHTDLCDLNYEKIGTLLTLYHKTSELVNRTPKIEKRDFQKIVMEAYENGCIDGNSIDSHLQSDIQRLLDKEKIPS